MKFVLKCCSSVAALGSLLSFAAFADVPPYVTIPPIVNGQPNPSYGGSGCPAGSARAVVSPDRQAFTMIFDSYIVYAEGAGDLDRKNCQILVNLDFPQGWSYSIFQMDYRGYFDISRGAMGTQQAIYYFSGTAPQGRLISNFYGPTSGDYKISDILGISALVWSPCGARRGLNINTSMIARVNANNPAGHSYMTTDSADGSVFTRYLIQWRKCVGNEQEESLG